MENGHDLNVYRSLVRPALTSKREEFIIFGYGNISEEGIWEFLVKKKWRKVKEFQLHEIVQSILSIKIGEYMNYASVEALKEADFTFDNEEDRLELLK